MSRLEPARQNLPGQKKINYVAVGICAVLLLAVVAIFGKTVNYDFVYLDDYDYICDNPHVTNGLTFQDITWAFTSSHDQNWHPLTWISHMLDCQLFGLENPWGHHLVNVLLHAAVAILLFLVLMRMTGDMWPSAFVAAVFAIHPLRAESVAWVAERKDVLSGLFFMLTLAAYIGYVRRPFSIARYLAVIAFFALGLMAKPMLVTLPFVLLLLDYWPLGRIESWTVKTQDKSRDGSYTTGPVASIQQSPQRVNQETRVKQSPQQNGFAIFTRLVLEKIPLFAMSAGSCMATVWAQTSAIVSITTVTLPLRMVNAAVAYVAYLGQFFYPVGLAVPYPYPELGLPLWKFAWAIIVLAIVSGIVFILRRRHPYLLTGWLWYLGMLVPVIGLMQVGSQSMADRYTYLPQIGLCIAIAWSVERVTRPWPNRGWVCMMGSGLAMALLMGCAWRQTSFWLNTETLCVRALECAPNNSIAHANLGTYCDDTGRRQEAIRHFEQAVKISPDFLDAQRNLGVLLIHSGRSPEALGPFTKALSLAPNDPVTHTNLGIALSATGRLKEALDQHERALRLDPNYAEVHINMVSTLLKLGRTQDAIAHCNQALRIKPSFAEAYYALAYIMDTTDRLAEAIDYYRKGLQFNPDNAAACASLTMALAKTNQSTEAIDMAQKTLKLAKSKGNTDLAKQIEDWLNSYRAGLPSQK
jgi:protein O-mannosyl-transferase